MNDLWQRVQYVTAQALNCGALRSISTRFEILSDGGVDFVIRIADSIERKEKAQTKQKDQQINPFLPYEPALYVTHLEPHHVCVLNKYNVFQNHLLIITEDFTPQEELLTRDDWQAGFNVLTRINGFLFYNSGAAAGASQPHKHLQLVPFANNSQEMALPIAPLIALLPDQDGILTLPQFKFDHGIIKFKQTLDVTETYESYRSLLQNLDLLGGEDQLPKPHNVIMMQDWIMVIPRCLDRYKKSIPINSLGFTGALLVKNQKKLDKLKKIGPMTVLNHVARYPDNCL
jgi:ATP adenylyltransferase